jgi:hypothetical protein
MAHSCLPVALSTAQAMADSFQAPGSASASAQTKSPTKSKPLLVSVCKWMEAERPRGALSATTPSATKTSADQPCARAARQASSPKSNA